MFHIGESAFDLPNFIMDFTSMMAANVPTRNLRPGMDHYGRRPLHNAAILGDLVLVTSLLDEGADPNRADDNGYTPLHFAAQESRRDLISLLLSRGASPNSTDIHGNSPLWTAVMNAQGRFEAMILLLHGGADRHHKNKHGRSPFDMAMTIGHGLEEVIKNERPVA
jgi:ankyrin repeat protein